MVLDPFPIAFFRVDFSLIVVEPQNARCTATFKSYLLGFQGTNTLKYFSKFDIVSKHFVPLSLNQLKERLALLLAVRMLFNTTVHQLQSVFSRPRMRKRCIYYHLIQIRILYFALYATEDHNSMQPLALSKLKF